MAVAQIPSSDAQHRAPILSFTVTGATSPSSSSSNSSVSRARTGQLKFTAHHGVSDTISGTTGNRVIATPALIAYTSRGAIPHLTRDNVARLPNEMVHISFEHLMDLPTPAFSVAPFSLHRFVGLHETKNQRSQIITAGLRDFYDLVEVPPATDDCAIANTLRGAVKVTPSDYLDLTLSRPPDILFAIGDENTTRASSKRIEKSLRRSLKWLREVAERAQPRTNVFAPLVGDENATARSEFAKGLLGVVSGRSTAGAALEEGERPIDDLVSGYTLLQPKAADSLENVATLFNTSLDVLPESKARIGLRVAGPHAILRIIRDTGLDLFVEEWTSRCASVGVGLDFEFPVPTTASPPSSKQDIGQSFFDLKFVEAFVPLSTSSLALPDREHPQPFGSEPPTQGYVHHLLHAHEMTAHVILALHNNIVMHNFLANIRQLIARGDGSFELEVDRFFAQYQESSTLDGEYPCVVEAKAGWKIVDKERGKGSLKDKRALDAAEGLAPTEQMALREDSIQDPLAAQ